MSRWEPGEEDRFARDPREDFDEMLAAGDRAAENGDRDHEMEGAAMGEQSEDGSVGGLLVGFVGLWVLGVAAVGAGAATCRVLYEAARFGWELIG